MADRKKRLGELLLDEGLIDRFQLQAALAEQKKWGGRLGRHLIELGILSEEVLVKILARILGLPSVDVGRLSISKVVIDVVPLKLVEKFNVVPIGVEESPGTKKTLIVAMSDPTNLAALDELRFTTGCTVRAVVAGDSSIERAIRTYYGGSSAPKQGVLARRGPADLTDARTDRTGESAPIPRLAPDDVTSIPESALTPLPDPSDEQARRLNALLRVLVRRKVVSEEEFLAELAKG